MVLYINCAIHAPGVKFGHTPGVDSLHRLTMGKKLNQRTNGPVNAHLRSAVYTNVIENSPSIGADEALGPFFFFRIINILSIQVFHFK